MNNKPAIPEEMWDTNPEEAQRLLDEYYQTPQQPVQQTQTPQPVQQPTQKATPQPNFGDVANGIGDVALSALQGISKGTLGMGYAIGEGINNVTGHAIPKALSYITGQGGRIASDEESKEAFDSITAPYKPRTGVGEFTQVLSKYITAAYTGSGALGVLGKSAGLAKDLAGGAIGDVAAWDKGESFVEQKWDDNLGDIGDRTANGIFGVVIGAGLNKISEVIKAKKLAASSGKVSPEELAKFDDEVQAVVKETQTKAIVKDITDQVGDDPQAVVNATKELPFEQAHNVLKEFDSQQELKLLETDSTDGVLSAGASETVAKEPYQMTKDEFRQSVAGKEQIQNLDESGNVVSKYNANIADRHLNEAVDKAWESRGLNKADNENQRQWLQRVVDDYKAKWGNPDLNVKVGIQDLKNKAGYVKPLEDGSVQLVVSKNNLYDKAGLRHELEHLHDVIKGKVPEDTHFSRYGDESNFAADYTHKKSITQAMREGKVIPDNVKAEYVDKIPGLQDHVGSTTTKVNDASGVNIPESNIKTATEAPTVKISDEHQAKLDELNKQLKGLDDPNYFEHHLRESGYPVDVVKGYEQKIKDLEAEYANALNKSDKGNTKRLRLKLEEIDKYKSELQDIKASNTTHADVSNKIKADKVELRNKISSLTKEATAKAEAKLQEEVFNQTPEAQAFHAEVQASGEVTETAIETLAKSDDTTGIVATLAKTAKESDPFVKETAEEFAHNSTEFMKELHQEMQVPMKFDDWIKGLNWNTQQIKQARLFYGALRKVADDIGAKVDAKFAEFIKSPEGASKARLATDIRNDKGKLLQLDMRGFRAEAGRLLQSFQRPEDIIDSINVASDFIKAEFVKHLEAKNITLETFDNAVKEATDTIQKLYAQSQGKAITAQHIEAVLTKSIGGADNFKTTQQWIKNEALRIFEDYKPGSDVNKMVKDALHNMIDHEDNIKAANDFIKANKPKNFWNLYFNTVWNDSPSYFIGNWLSGINTFSTNGIGGIANTVARNLFGTLSFNKEATARAIDEIIPLYNNFTKAIGIGFDVFKGGKPKYGMAGQYLENFDSLSDALNQAENKPIIGSRESFNLEQLGLDWKPNSIESAALWISKWLGLASHTFTRGIQSGDEFITSWNYLSKAQADAIRKARVSLEQSTKGNYTPAQLNELATKLLNEGSYFNAVKKPINEQLYNEARAAGLINPISREESKATIPYAVGSLASKIKSDHKFLKFVIPFTNVATRLVQNAIDITPVAYVPKVGSYWHEFAQGGERAAIAQGKVNLGLTTALGGFLFAMGGRATGSLPMDSNRKKALLSQNPGWKPYSIIVSAGDKDYYVPYKAVEPFATMFGIGADLHDNMEHFTEGEVDEVLKRLVFSIGENISNKSFIESLGRQVDILRPDNWGDNTAKGFSSNVAGIIPGSSLMNDLAGMVTEDHLKEPREFMQNLMSRNPLRAIGLGGTPVDKLNPLGEPIDVSLGKRILRSDIGFVKHNALNDELAKLADKGLMLPAPAKDSKGSNLKDFVNQDGTTAYDAIQRLKATVKIDGKTLRQALTELVKSKEYQQMYTGESTKEDGQSISYKNPVTRIGQIEYTYNMYYQQALNEVLYSNDFKHKETGNTYEVQSSKNIDQQYNPPQQTTTQALQGIFGD